MSEESLGDKIYRLRKDLGLSQEDLADRIGVSRQTISKWETNFMVPAAENLQQLCQLFSVNADHFFESYGETFKAHGPRLPSAPTAEKPQEKRSAKRALIIALIADAVLLIISSAVSAFAACVVFSPNKGVEVVKTVVINNSELYCLFVVTGLFLLAEIIMLFILIRLIRKG